MEYIKDIKIDAVKSYHGYGMSDSYEITLVDNNDREINNVDFIKILGTDVNSFKNNKYKKDLLIDIINKIYLIHIRYKILRLSYPIYMLHLTGGGKGKVDTMLIGFRHEVNTTSKIVIPEFVNIINILGTDETNKVLNNLDEMWLNNNVELLGIPKATCKIYNIDNCSAIGNGALYHIDKFASTNNNEVKFNNLKNIHVDRSNYHSKSIKRIIFGDTCTITDIRSTFFNTLDDIKEVQLCKSIKTIDGIELYKSIRIIGDKQALAVQNKIIDLI
ncbi:MAG: hypothetical protein J6A59_17905 [Lachnospiraceae bacterium]|nr:hypothetical protein [Lachnospiraceae bacterium]